MRGRTASIAAATTLLVFLIFLFASGSSSYASLHQATRHFRGQYPYKGRPESVQWNPPKPKYASESDLPERLIVKVKLENEDTSWIQKLEPTWQTKVISIKSMYAHLHPDAHRPDKGRIANAYLTWIVENYNNLPEILVFLPPRDTWERKPLDFHNILSNLQIPFIQDSGFANLRCPYEMSDSTCNDKPLQVFEPAHPIHEFRNETSKIWTTLFSNTTDVPLRFGTVLGAELVVSKAQVQKRSAEEYLKYWTWLNKATMDDDSTGLVMEYMWPIVFGKEEVFCPEPVQCKCELYGKCDQV
jgi:hypothetical protein